MPEQDPFKPDIQAMQETRWETLEDIVLLIELVRRCWKVEDYYLLQQQLEKHIDRVDRATEEANYRYKKAKDEAKQKQAQLEHAFYRGLGYQYRAVGDALAWQAYAFQALNIYALGMNQSHGPRTQFMQRGIGEEKKQKEMLWCDHGAFALHHDCTNYLRIGDLSIFYPDQLNMPEIKEVKVGGRSGESRQKKREQMVADLIRNYKSIQADGFELRHRAFRPTTINNVEHTNLEFLRQALLQAREESIGFSANSYLTITVLDTMNRSQRKADQLHSEWLTLRSITASLMGAFE